MRADLLLGSGFGALNPIDGAAKAELLQGQAKKFIHGFNAEHLNLGVRHTAIQPWNMESQGKRDKQLGKKIGVPCLRRPSPDVWLASRQGS